MSYSKRPTTPVSAQEAEGMLIVGYWIASRQTTVPRICERHMNILLRLDRQEAVRKAAEKAAEKTAELPELYQQQITELQRRRQLVTNVAPQPIQQFAEPIVSFCDPTVPTTPIIAEQFALGAGPLTNENTITPHPALLIPDNPQQPFHAQPGTIEGALEAARMPPTEGGKVTHSCPMCGEQITTGEVHTC